MRHFSFLDDAATEALFLRPPHDIDVDADRGDLATSLGATLYAPGTRPSLVKDVCLQAARGVTSMVLCLEDSIPDDQVAAAEANVIGALRELHEIGLETPGALPLLFVRVRTRDQVPLVVDTLGAATGALAGFVLPKIGSAAADTAADGGGEGRGEAWIAEIDAAAERAGHRLWAMPVLEGAEMIYRESRTGTLLAIRALADRHPRTVLALRVGATDLSGLYGLRRARDLTIYDIAVVRDCIADMVNICGRRGPDGEAPVLAGPVWEYFASPERLFVSPLRVTPFEQADPVGPEHGAQLRHELVSRNLDRLIREVVLDKANGLTGKSVIHPSHVAAVHALLAVTHEEYTDAVTVLGGDGGGVARSSYENKMNELRPHRVWAELMLRRGRVFGVLNDGRTFVDLLGTFG